MNKIALTRCRDSVRVEMPAGVADRLQQTPLTGCPFREYYALDLLRDFVRLYSWRMEYGTPYTVGDFLTLCNDAKADLYRAIFTE